MTSEALKYQKLDEIEHILLRPGMYIGATTNMSGKSWTVANSKMIEEELIWNPGLLKMFDEVISNSVDEHIRSGKVSIIKINLFPMTGQIQIQDDGGIPVQIHPEHKLYIPSMIFGELRTGSNFNDEERVGAGMNGLGAKLTSVFSKEFIVDTCDGKKRFVQKFEENLSIKNDPQILTSNIKGTSITFVPDYERLGCELDESNIKKITKRVYDVAGCNPKIKVFLNGSEIKINKFEQYVQMFSDVAVYDDAGDWEVAVAPAPEDGFRQVSFVNGIDVYNGGSHVDYVSVQICGAIRDFVKKKHKVDVKPNTIRQQLFLFIKCKINAPMFTSQTKDNLVSEVRTFGTSYSPSDKFMKKVLESEVVQKVLDWAEGEKRRNDLAELRKLNKQTQNTNFLKRITKFDDATSKDRSKCTIYLTEGDSAAKTILSARDANFHGVFPLKGKPLNVRDIEVKKLVANDEFQNIMSILGLKIGQEVKSVNELRFSKIGIATDNDPDGQHISGLLFNLFNEFWPELLKMGVVYRMITPLIVVENKGKRFEFFDQKSYNTWAETAPTHKKHYFKGLGGFMTKDFERFLKEEDIYLKKITVIDKTDIDQLDVAFDKKKADARKDWLMENN